ncbi:MAG: hypothetical protein JKX70_08105 [Phycisphaerales bacterium]|nr:hypothetical protein [Phycisphaerales bacterium]
MNPSDFREQLIRACLEQNDLVLGTSTGEIVFTPNQNMEVILPAGWIEESYTETETGTHFIMPAEDAPRKILLWNLNSVKKLDETAEYKEAGLSFDPESVNSIRVASGLGSE